MLVHREMSLRSGPGRSRGHRRGGCHAVRGSREGSEEQRSAQERSQRGRSTQEMGRRGRGGRGRGARSRSGRGRGSGSRRRGGGRQGASGREDSWTKTMTPVVIQPFQQPTGPAVSISAVILEVFFTTSLIDLIVEQSNLYASQVMGPEAYVAWRR